MEEVTVQGLRTGNRLHFRKSEYKWPLSFVPAPGDYMAAYGPTSQVVGTVKESRFTITANTPKATAQITIFVQD